MSLGVPGERNQHASHALSGTDDYRTTVIVENDTATHSLMQHAIQPSYGPHAQTCLCRAKCVAQFEATKEESTFMAETQEDDEKAPQSDTPGLPNDSTTAEAMLLLVEKQLSRLHITNHLCDGQPVVKSLEVGALKEAVTAVHRIRDELRSAIETARESGL